MKQLVVPGQPIDALTVREAKELLAETYRETVQQRFRAPATIQLDANGNGEDEVYTPPAGMEAEVRRVTVDMDKATDPGTGNVALGAGHTVEYLRGVGGTRIEWGQPAFGPAIQVPGVQSWGDEQGPYVRNQETFAIRVRGLTANAILDVTVEGIQRQPPKERD